MILRLRFLANRVYAAGAKATIPWPPEPARLMAALVNAWGTSGRNFREEALLRALERMPPPAINAPPISEEVRYNSYVPASEFTRKGSVPTRNVKTWVVASTQGNPVVHFYFNDLPPDQLGVLDALLAKVGRFGHSRNSVLLDRVSDGPPPNFRPLNAEAAHGNDGVVYLRTFYPGFLDELEERFQRWPRARRIPGRHLPYGFVASEPGYRPPFVFESATRIAIRPALPLVYWPRLVEEIRAAVLAEAGTTLGISDQELGWLHGHVETSPSEPRHLALTPLAFVGDRWADGRILGAAFLLPRSHQKQVGRLTEILWRLASRRFRFGPWDLRITPPLGTQKSLLPERWTRPSRRWASVTPVVWDRFPKRRKEADTVRRMAEYAWLPAPSAYKIMPHSPLQGVPASREFHLAGRWQGFTTHMLLEFPQPIPGPVLLGRGRYFGMGFFAPIEEGNA